MKIFSSFLVFNALEIYVCLWTTTTNLKIHLTKEDTKISNMKEIEISLKRKMAHVLDVEMAVQEAELKKKKKKINIFFPLGLDGRFTTSLCSHLFRFPLPCTTKRTLNNFENILLFSKFPLSARKLKRFVNWELPDSGAIFIYFSRNRFLEWKQHIKRLFLKNYFDHIIWYTFYKCFLENFMDYVRHGKIQGRSSVFFKSHCPCILPCLT